MVLISTEIGYIFFIYSPFQSWLYFRQEISVTMFTKQDPSRKFLLKFRKENLPAIRKNQQRWLNPYRRQRDRRFEQSMDALEACVVAGAVKNPWQASALNLKTKISGILR